MTTASAIKSGLGSGPMLRSFLDFMGKKRRKLGSLCLPNLLQNKYKLTVEMNRYTFLL